VDEIPSATDFYDGSQNLNVIKVNCNIYSNPKICLTHSNCGWCGSTNRCVLGNNLGPHETCTRSSYIYSAPYPNWTSEMSVVKGEIANVTLNLSNK